MTDHPLHPEHRTRIDLWRAARDFVAIGNLGEQVTARLLIEMEYQVLATQDDLMGGVANILDLKVGMGTQKCRLNCGFGGSGRIA